MRKSHRIMLGTAVAVLALLPSTASNAAAEAQAPPCPNGAVCLWPGEHFAGAPYTWFPRHGNVFLGDRDARLVDHVGSVVSNTYACFIDTGQDANGHWIGYRVATPDAERGRYLADFGGRMDRIAPRDRC